MNFYNEFDPHAAAWLRELIAQGLIPSGVVDERSITDIQPHELTGYTQCHFFAGIGGWSLALELAGWPATRPVWTGSCPCQPFSSAGKRLGAKDDRHLWPVFASLISECRPQRVFGEQVAQSVGFGWLDGVSADLEAEGYTVGAAVLGAHSVGAPHIRQRLFWVANSNDGNARVRGVPGAKKSARGENGNDHDGRGGGMADSISERRCVRTARIKHASHAASSSETGWGSHFIRCADGKSRRIEPGIAPLAHGVSGRVGLLRGYGNAIVPQVAAEFIMAFNSVSGRD